MTHSHGENESAIKAVKRAVPEADGLPFVFPVMSLGEIRTNPTTVIFRNLMAMELEEQITSQPMDSVVLLGGCDKTVPADDLLFDNEKFERRRSELSSRSRPSRAVAVGRAVVGRDRGDASTPQPQFMPRRADRLPVLTARHLRPSGGVAARSADRPASTRGIDA
jgi:hypothetical protein